MAEIIVLTKENFKKEISNTDTPILVDFWAPWCGPCRMLAPNVEKFSSSHSEIRVGKVNVDEETDIASMFNIMTIPTLILFKNGEAYKRQVGYVTYEELEAFIQI